MLEFRAIAAVTHVAASAHRLHKATWLFFYYTVKRQLAWLAPLQAGFAPVGL